MSEEEIIKEIKNIYTDTRLIADCIKYARGKCEEKFLHEVLALLKAIEINEIAINEGTEIKRHSRPANAQGPCPDFIITTSGETFIVEIVTAGEGNTVDRGFKRFTQELSTYFAQKYPNEQQIFSLGKLWEKFYCKITRIVLSNETALQEKDKEPITKIHLTYKELHYCAEALGPFSNYKSLMVMYGGSDPIDRYLIIKLLLEFIKQRLERKDILNIVKSGDKAHKESLNILMNCIKLLEDNISVPLRKNHIIEFSSLIKNFREERCTVSLLGGDLISENIYYTLIDSIITTLISKLIDKLRAITSKLIDRGDIISPLSTPPNMSNIVLGEEAECNDIKNILKSITDKFDKYNSEAAGKENVRLLIIKLAPNLFSIFKDSKAESYIKKLAKEINKNSNLKTHKYFTKFLIVEDADNDAYFLFEQQPLKNNGWILSKHKNPVDM